MSSISTRVRGLLLTATMVISLVVSMAPSAAAATTGTVSGRVVNSAGQPLTGADSISVCLLPRPAGGFDFADLDSAGRFQFTGVAFGDYHLLIQRDNGLICRSPVDTPYVSQEYRFNGDDGNSTTFSVSSAAPNKTLLDVVMLRPGELYAITSPAITGRAVVGATLTASAARWTPAPVTVTRQWKANGVAIAGATGSTLVVPASALGKTVTVTESATKAGFTPASKTSAPTAAVTAPVLSGPTPSITGTARVGARVSAAAGTWSPAPVTLAYQWKANGAPISGATASSYVVAPTMLGRRLTVTVTGSKTGFPTLATTSAATAAVLAGTLTAPVPTVAGTAKVGLALSARPGSWAPAPVALSYVWKANGVAISGATAATYKVGPSLVGRRITVTVTGAKSGYTTAAKTSAVTAPVLAGSLTAPAPKISGTAQVGKRLTAVPGTWGPAPVALKYQWRINGAAVAKATASTFAVPASARGRTVTVTVNGSKAGYTSASKTSAKTAVVR